MNRIALKKVKKPACDFSGISVPFSDQTIQERKQKILQAMAEKKLDQLVVYSDVEHGGNFEYLVGYFPRFEEGLLVINRDSTMTILLGNENLNKASKARVEVRPIHVSLFSLPNQPNRSDKTLNELLQDAGIKKDQRIGIVGWKWFTSEIEDNRYIFDVPSYIVDAIKQIVNNDKLVTNEADIFIGSQGVRNTNNANEIAYFEFGASLASDSMLETLDRIEVGKTELELADTLIRKGQHTNVVTIFASGKRYVNANMFPTDNKIQLGDPISITVGHRGGLSSRAGYVVHEAEEIPGNAKDYLDRIAKPYFNAYVHWLETIKIGMTGDHLYQEIERILPKETYGWTLCPGHLTGYEEWQSSPLYQGSQEVLKSGMIFQVDIIPSIEGYAGSSAESTVVLADKALKASIQQDYPAMWARMEQRIAYMKEVLGIALSDDVLPMCSSVAYLRPFLLDQEAAFVIEHE